MTFPPNDPPDRREAAFVTQRELYESLQRMVATERDARHDQTNRITGVIGQNHETLTKEIQALRIDILTANAEPQATAAGRALSLLLAEARKRQDDHDDRIESLERWRDGLVGAYNLARLAFGASLFSAAASLIALWKALNP